MTGCRIVRHRQELTILNSLSLSDHDFEYVPFKCKYYPYPVSNWSMVLLNILSVFTRLCRASKTVSVELLMAFFYKTIQHACSFFIKIFGLFAIYFDPCQPESFIIYC